MTRRALTLPLAASFALAAVVSIAPHSTAADAPPEHLRAQSLLPPGESGFFSVPAQAKYEADGDPSDFGPHVDDQRAPYWHYGSTDDDFQPPEGTPTEPRPGVRIYRDRYGVPLVYGDNGYDVWFGAGFAAASDRLFEIDAIRRTARGTLAELTGPSGVPADLQERVLTYTNAEYDAMLARLSPAGRAAIRGYAAGVEARIQQVKSDPTLLPAEYAVLQATPADWTVEDTLASGVYITRDVAAQGGDEMANVASLRRLENKYGTAKGRRAFAALYPDDDPHAVTTIKGERFSNLAAAARTATAQARAYAKAVAYADGLPLDLTSGPGTGDAAVPSPTPASPTTAHPVDAAKFGGVVKRLEAWRRGLHGGSFAYAISGRRTASGHAMLSSNPQLDYSYPSLLWELEVHGGGYDARGVGVPGIPTVGIGHTADVAWGLTTGYSKTIDSFIETTRPNPTAGGPPQYLHNGTWHDESCRTETVHYREAVQGVPVGPPTFSQDYQVCRTVHGPVVATSADGRRARTVDYAMWQHDVDTVNGILRWDRARSLDDIAAGVREVTWNENIVAADSAGHTGYWHPGRYFRRPAGVDQRFPLDGRGAQDPKGYLTYEEMPHVIDPPDGYVVNWNTKPAAGWVDGDLSGTNTRPGGPVNRVLDLQRQLASRSDFTPDDLMRIDRLAGESDHRARGYLPLLLALRSRTDLTPSERSALSLLAKWDGRAYAPGASGGSSPMSTPPESTTDGPAATLFAEVTKDAKRSLFGALPSEDKARLDTLSTESHQYDATPMDNLAIRVLRPGLSGLGAPTVVTGAREPSVVVRRALDSAISHLSSVYGQDPKAWRRAHGISHIESLTGVIGPSATEPFEDRGTWVQHVAFTTGRPMPLLNTEADGAAGAGGSLATTGSNGRLAIAGFLLLLAAGVGAGILRLRTWTRPLAHEACWDFQR
ncbi:MAG TPA: penicillin acylase family protein [Mycobacteriales bacterium]|nr:penicillin acylase family protein [Mycobacteriales bacterium]